MSDPAFFYKSGEKQHINRISSKKSMKIFNPYRICHKNFIFYRIY